jgi:hypothetical protein
MHEAIVKKFAVSICESEAEISSLVARPKKLINQAIQDFPAKSYALRCVSDGAPEELHFVLVALRTLLLAPRRDND